MSAHEKQDTKAEAVPDGARTAASESEIPGNGAQAGDVEVGRRQHTPHWKENEVQEIPHKYVLNHLDSSSLQAERAVLVQ